MNFRRAVFVAAVMIPVAANSASPEEVAREIKAWRENCSDPDPDLRIGYLTAVIQTKNTTLIRACLRPLLTSDNADTRNLAIRAALASSERLSLTVSMPENVRTVLDESDAQSHRQRRSQQEAQMMQDRLREYGGVIGLKPQEVSLDQQRTKWATFALNSTPIEQAELELTLVGTVLAGNGMIALRKSSGIKPVTVKLELQGDGVLRGSGTLDGVPGYIAELPLL